MRITDSLYDPMLDQPATLHVFADAMLALMQDGIFLPPGAQKLAYDLAQWGMLTRRNICSLLAITPTQLAGYEGRIAEQRREMLYGGVVGESTNAGPDNHGTCSSDDEEIPMFDE